MAGSAGRSGGHSAGDGGDGTAPGSASRAADRPGDSAQSGSGAAPLLTVIRGDASAEEIAALTAVLTAVGARPAGPPADPGGRGSGWAGRPALLRRPLSHGPGAWRASGRPGQLG
jgi:hypothetical protein